VSNQKDNLLRLMRFWLFGTFVIVWAAITVYIGLFTNRDWFAAIKAGFPIWGITGVLCIIWYLGYAYWLRRRPD
jgi:uncharacterized RDD family membrane protein YckC